MSKDGITENIIEWLQLCFELLEEGREDEIPRDIFYRSQRGDLTDGYVDRVIVAVDNVFKYEMDHFAGYHFREADGAVTTPDFCRLGREARRALVEGLDRIMGYQAN